jgi:4-amino-4-deoxy-L-arabinose transferase-like glycosyltransferase
VLSSTKSLSLNKTSLAAKNLFVPWENFIYLIIVLHIIAWTLLPLLVRYNLPQDAIEGSIWGQHFEWGYDKNPFLNGWLSGLANLLDNRAGWGTYFFSQVSVGICFWAVWELGKQILSPLNAFIGVLLLEGVQYFSLHAIDFNDNTIELALWALTTLYFFNALKSQRTKDWILTGIFAGLGMMTKFYMLMLLLPMLGFLIVRRDCRQSFFTAKPYFALVAFLVIIAPHLYWLSQHDFITVHYALERVNRPDWAGYFRFANLFFWQQLETFIPALLLFTLLLFGKRPIQATPRENVSSFDKQFLFYLGIGPFLLTVVIALFSGIKLRAGWGMPLLSLWGLLLVALVQPRLTKARLALFIVGFVGLVSSTLGGYAYALMHMQHSTSANFPGKEMANVLTRQWHKTYHVPLFYVAGSRWLAGNVAYYSHDRPDVFVDWDKNSSQWINEADVKSKGAIFIWDASKGEKLTPELMQRFAKLGPVKLMHFSWWRSHELAPVEMAVAFLAPEGIVGVGIS